MDMGPADKKTQIKRRISFSGRHLVREFHGEEEPKTWNNSYEISDHLNNDETVSSLYSSTKPKQVKSSINKTQENKENYTKSRNSNNLEEFKPYELTKNQNNISGSKHISVFNISKDLINVSYQNSKLYQIENTLDITLCDREMKFRIEKNKEDERTTTNIHSFSLDDDEKGVPSTGSEERTIDFMSEFQSAVAGFRGNDNTSNDNRKSLIRSKTNKYPCTDIACSDVKNATGATTIYMNETITMSRNEECLAVNPKIYKMKTARQAIVIDSNYCDKENNKPASKSYANETVHNYSDMEIEDISVLKSNRNVYIDKEPKDFQDKLSCISFLQESNDNIRLDKAKNNKLQNEAENTKYRPTIKFNQSIELSPQSSKMEKQSTTIKSSKQMDLSPKIFRHDEAENTKYRPTINFNQSIELSPQGTKKEKHSTIITCSQQMDLCPKKVTKHDDVAFQSLKPRQTNVFNEFIENSPLIEYEKSKEKWRHTIYLNQPIVEDSDNQNKIGAMRKIEPCSTINFNQSIEISPVRNKPVLSRQNINCNEEIHISPEKPLHASIVDKVLIKSESTNKCYKQPIKVVRKIYTSPINKEKNTDDVNSKKSQKEHIKPNVEKIQNANVQKTSPVSDKSLNFSISSVKNMSLSPESSFIIPAEFKTYNFKQLNDEIEKGKIQVFLNASKTPRILRTGIHLNSKPQKQRTLVFDDVDISIGSNVSIKKDEKNISDHFDFDVIHDINEKEIYNVRHRYSQAGDSILDNTSFLTKAKLSDDTQSRNNSGKEIIQLNDTMDMFNESSSSAIESNKTYNKNYSCGVNKTLCTVFQNVEPIFTQTVKNDPKKISDIKVSIKNNSTNEMECSFNTSKRECRQTIYLNEDIESCENDNQKIINEDSILQCKISPETDECEKKLKKNQLLKEEKNKRQSNYPNSDLDELIENQIIKEGKAGLQNICTNSNIEELNKNICQTEKPLHSSDFVHHDNSYAENYENQMICTYNEVNKFEINNKSNNKFLKAKHTRQTACFENDIGIQLMSMNKKTISQENNNYMDNSINRHDKQNQINDLHTKDSLELTWKISKHPSQAFENDNNTASVITANDKNLPLGMEPVTDLKTVIFEHEIELDDNNENYPECVENKSLKGVQNAAEITLERNASTVSMASKLKSILKKQVNALATPVKSGASHHLLNLTPQLSLIEFMADEKRSKEGKIQRKVQCISSTSNDTANKRLHSTNLTPLQSTSKKRQTLIFSECSMDESIKSIGVAQTNEQNRDSLLRNECKIGNLVSDEPVLQIPAKQRQSRIPIPVSSDEMSHTNRSLKETEEEQDVENDNFAESIQIIRRATTFTQIKDMPMEHTVDDVKKPLFGDNPITISDVSIFFEAQRKSQIAAPQTDVSLDIGDINMSGINALEKNKDVLENRYIHLTLEEIDKTCLSLVQASYEYECDDRNISKCINEEEPTTTNIFSSVVCSQFKENSKILESKQGSINNLKERSAICRKCKRCQVTLLNETTSSTSNSYVLPELPPIPDLELDRLNLLRERPTISDINVLWQNRGLNPTFINDINISNDSYVTSNIKDNTNDEYSSATIYIRRYKSDMQDFQKELLEKRLCEASFKPPLFVALLNNASIYLNNWIFDFQKQNRGILVFKHRQMLTFSLLFIYDEIDRLGYDIKIKEVQVERGHIPEKYWKPIDFVLDFQFKLNLPFDLQSLCEDSNESGILKMLQTIDRVCKETIKMGILLQTISFKNHAHIVRDGSRTYLRKIVRNIVNGNDADKKQCMEKIYITVELLNLRNLSFKDICNPPLYNFCENIHLLPVGLQFLSEFLPNPLLYLKT